MGKGVCKTCSPDYHPKEDELNLTKNYTLCYKDPDKYYLDNDVYKNCYQSCLTCDREGDITNHSCTKCAPKYNFFISTYDNHFNCFVECPFYFFFDEKGNYNCTNEKKCDHYPYIYLINGEKQCVKNCNETNNKTYLFQQKCWNQCPEGSRPSDEDQKKCKLICPFERPFEIIDLQICVTNCSIIERKNKYCVTNYEGNKTNEVQDKVQNDIYDEIIDSFNYSLLSDNESLIIVEKGITYELTTTKYKNTNSNTSRISLGKCEDDLKDYYQIEKDEGLYILKIDADIGGKTGPSVIYEFFYSFPDSKNLKPLDLTLCEGSSVKVTFPINLTDPELYDKNSKYYNDICYSLKSDSNVDLILDDRQNEYANNNKSLCEENCLYLGYNTKTLEAECSCMVKINLPLISEIKVDKNKLYKQMDFKKIVNFDFLKCYNLLLTKKGIAINIGFYIFIPNFIMYFVCIVFFYKNEFQIFKNQINDLSYAKNNLKYIEKKPILKSLNNKNSLNKNKIGQKDKYVKPAFLIIQKAKKDLTRKSLSMNNNLFNNKRPNNKRIWKSKNNLNKIFNNKIKTQNYEIEEESIDEKGKNSKNLLNSIKNNDKKKRKNAPPKNKCIIINNNNNNNNKNIKDKLDKISSKNSMLTNNKNNNNNNNKLSKTEKERIQYLMQQNDKELNELEYKQALKYDHRTFFEYYCSLLKTNHIIVKVFNLKDYNSRIIKIYLCFFNFGIYLSINALFFTDKTMHQIYQDDGEFNFVYQLPQIIYSAIISFFCQFIMEKLSLSQDNIIEFKGEKLVGDIAKKAKILLNTLYFKFIIFFIFSFLFLIIFWYYTSCFCAVYKNTQFHLIKDAMISFGTSMITPLGISLIPGLFRIPALKKRKSLMFTFSRILQFL